MDSVTEIHLKEYTLVYDTITSAQNTFYDVIIIGYHNVTLKCAEIANLGRTFPASRIILHGGNIDFQTPLPFIGVGANGRL